MARLAISSAAAPMAGMAKHQSLCMARTARLQIVAKKLGEGLERPAAARNAKLAPVSRFEPDKRVEQPQHRRL